MRKNINTLKFVILHNLLKKKDVTLFFKLLRNSEKSMEELQEEQDFRLRKMIAFAYENVPFYEKHFKHHGIIPSDIKKIRDLQLLAISVRFVPVISELFVPVISVQTVPLLNKMA